MSQNSQIHKHISHFYFLLAFGLINVLALTLLLCTVGLLAGITISWWQFPVASVGALVLNYYASKFFLGEKAKGNFIRSTALVVVLLAGSIIIVGCIYDFSFDGQWYHQETVIRLKQGYNPAYQALQVPADEQSIDFSSNWCMDKDLQARITKDTSIIPVNLKFLNINHFSKGTEAIESAIYQSTGRIERGKAVNIIMLVASFFLALALLYKVDRIGVISKWLLAIILSCNPITIKELFTFCVDGFGASLLLCLLLIFCIILLEQNRWHYLLMASVLILVVNVKFTMLVFADIYIFGFLLFIIIFRKIAILKNVLITSAFAVVIGVVVCGFNPYLTNMVRKHNIFYGLNETRDEIKRMTPAPFLGRNNFENLFLSLSAHEGWDVANRNTVSNIPKIPFTLNKNDIIEGNEDEASIAAFGPFFSGALLVAVVVLVFGAFKSRKTQAFKYAISVIVLILFTVLIIPDSWWLRFVPQLWLVPAVIIIMAEFMQFKTRNPLRFVLYTSQLLNAAWSMLIFVFVVFNTSRMNYQLQQVKALGKPVNIEFCNYRSFKSNLVRFREVGIMLTDTPVNNGKIYGIAFSSTKFITTAPLPDLPKSAILKLAEKLSSR